jgi:hypothetical protein
MIREKPRSEPKRTSALVIREEPEVWVTGEAGGKPLPGIFSHSSISSSFLFFI